MKEKPVRPALMTLAQLTEQEKREAADQIERRARFADDDDTPRIIGRYEDTGDFKYARRR